MFRRQGTPAETIKLFRLKSEAREGAEHADCTKDGPALPVMLLVHPLFGKIICKNIYDNLIIQIEMQIVLL